MSMPLSRIAASLSLRERFARRTAFLFLSLCLFAASAQAIVVRGHVLDATGKPLANARVQLVTGGSVVAVVYADAQGLYEIRYANAGRFTVLGYSANYLPAIGMDFYGGTTDVIEHDVILSTDTLRQDVSVTETGIPTPLPQLTAPVGEVPGELLQTRLGVVDELRQIPGVFMVQTGQTGSVTSLFLRGGNSTANLVLIDGMPAGDVGGYFDFGTVSSTAISQIEVVRGPDSAMYGTDAGAGVVSISTPRGTSLRPQVDYSGDAGNLHTWRNEVTVGGTLNQLDYFGAFSRLNTSNALPLDRFHAQTSAINVGYDINGNTQARFTLRNGDSVAGVPGAWDFQGISQNNRLGDQDLYSTATIENRYKGDWHNLLRYGIARKREQEAEFAAGGTFLAVDPGEYGGPGNVGNVVTIRGANGYSVKGQVQLFSGDNYDQDSNRDQLYYQSDYTFNRHLTGLFGFRYDNERGSYNLAVPAYSYFEHEKIQRTNFEYNLQLQGEFWDKLFYSAGGALEKNDLYGIKGTPRFGLSYVPVRPSSGFFHGTRLRANAASGLQEPSLALYYNSLDLLLTQGNYASLISKYGIAPQGPERSHTYDLGIDQNIFGSTLVLKAGYFHNVFDHQIEGVAGNALIRYLGFPNVAPFNTPYFEAYVNSMAFRAQGAEIELQWHPKPRLLLRAGYTNLSARVVQSFSTDAVAAKQGLAFANPNFPNVPIGIFGPLVGARPFRRAPNTGFFDVQYTRSKFSIAFKGALASRSDDSTFLSGEDLNGGNTLLLPNHDLDFGYVKLDLGGTYSLPHHLLLFTQLDNLLNDQHIGPIGYPGLPLTVRAGLKWKLFGD